MQQPGVGQLSRLLQFKALPPSTAPWAGVFASIAEFPPLIEGLFHARDVHADGRYVVDLGLLTTH